MSKNDKKFCISIYFPRELKEIIEGRAKIFRRSQTEETIFLIEKGLELEQLKTDVLLEKGIISN